MTEKYYSPLNPAEIRAVIESIISTVPMPASWELLPQQPNALYYGKTTELGFDLVLASGVGRGNSLLEVLGEIATAQGDNEKGCRIKLTHQPSRTSQVAWMAMLLFFLIFFGLVMLNYKTTGRFSGVVILPIFGLLGMLLFVFLFKEETNKSRCFLTEILQLRKVSADF